MTRTIQPASHGRAASQRDTRRVAGGSNRLRAYAGGHANRSARSFPWWKLIVAAVIAMSSAAVAVQIWRAHDQTCRAHGQIISADQITAEEGTDASPPPGLVSYADRFAACGGGQLLVLRGAGEGGVQAGPAVSLRIYRERGELENDPTAQAAKVQNLVDSAFRVAQRMVPPGDGRDLIGLLGAISAKVGSGQNEVWLQTLGLPTVNPANARSLMAADPTQAVASIARWVPSLHGVHVHLVLSPPAGKQPRLDTATDAWRRQFMLALLRQAGAEVVSVTEVETAESPAPRAPPAPVVPNLPEPSPRLPKPQPGKVYATTLDSSALFIPNSTRFLYGAARVRAKLQPIISGWRHGLFSRVVVVGHCARFGPPQGALRLSRARAFEIADLLRASGVTAVIAVGVGYSEPLPPNPESATNRVVVVTAYPKS